MKLLARMTRLAGHWVKASYIREAVITTEHCESCVLLIDGKPVPPQAAETARYKILEASDGELEILGHCVYRFLLEEETAQRNLGVAA